MSECRCVRCTVSNCKYHAKENNECQANEIEVGPHYANSSTDTVCDTFKPCENC